MLLALVVAAFVSRGDSLVDLIGTNPPAADAFDIGRVEFKPGEIRIRVRSPQPEELTIASVTVDDAIVPFTLDGPATLKRLRSSTIIVPYTWVENDPISVGVTSSTGIETVKEIPAAVETPARRRRGFLGYGLIGLLVGVVPVALGLLWLPSLRRANPNWLAAFMAMTAGLLSFLGVEALSEAFTLQALLPGGLGGAGLVLLGVALSALGMTFLSSRLSRGRAGTAGLSLAFLVAIGIGVHNLGEGLAIGTSFAVRRAAARHVPDRRLHDPQRHRGPRDRRSGGREPSRHVAAARGAGADRRRAGRARGLDRRLRARTTCSACCSSAPPPAPRSRSSSRSAASSPAARRVGSAPAG